MESRNSLECFFGVYEKCVSMFPLIYLKLSERKINVTRYVPLIRNDSMVIASREEPLLPMQLVKMNKKIALFSGEGKLK